MTAPTGAAPPLDPFGVIPRIMSGETRVVRQSNMNTADICLKRLGFELNPSIAGGTGEARIVGTAYHSGQEAYYSARADGEVLPLEAIHQAAAVSFWKQVEEAGDIPWDKDPTAAAFKVSSMLTAYHAGEHFWGPEFQVVGVEQEWYAPVTDALAVKGTIDLVLETEPGEIILVDHKTAGRKWVKDKEHARKNAQTVLYAWAWWRVTGVEVTKFYFDVMSYKGEFDRRLALPRPDHMTAVLEKAQQLSALIEAVGVENLPANTSSNLCSSKYCDYWDICPFGQPAL